MRKKQISADDIAVQFSIGTRIQYIRQSLNLNQEPFAEELDKKYNELYPNDTPKRPYARSTIGKWESGITTPDIKTLYAIAALTDDYDIGFLLGLYQQANYNEYYIKNITGLPLESIYTLKEINEGVTSGDSLKRTYSSLFLSLVVSILSSEKMFSSMCALALCKQINNSESSRLLTDAKKFEALKGLSDILDKIVSEVD